MNNIYRQIIVRRLISPRKSGENQQYKSRRMQSVVSKLTSLQFLPVIVCFYCEYKNIHSLIYMCHLHYSTQIQFLKPKTGFSRNLPQVRLVVQSQRKCNVAGTFAFITILFIKQCIYPADAPKQSIRSNKLFRIR